MAVCTKTYAFFYLVHNVSPAFFRGYQIRDVSFFFGCIYMMKFQHSKVCVSTMLAFKFLFVTFKFLF